MLTTMVIVSTHTNFNMPIVAVEAKTDLDPNSIQPVAYHHNSAINKDQPVKIAITACSIGQVQQLLAIVASIKMEAPIDETVATDLGDLCSLQAYLVRIGDLHLVFDTVIMVASFVADHTVVKATFVDSLTEVDILHIVTGASFEVVAYLFFLNFYSIN